MASAKELKNNPEYNINMFELFSMFGYENKSKYPETLLRIMKKTPNIDEHHKEVIKHFNDEYNIPTNTLKTIPKLQLLFFYRLISEMFNTEDLKTFQKFCEYNERNLIKQNDVSTYQSFDEINTAVGIADIVAQQKDLEKQVRVVYEDSEWLLLRPLTYTSSKKYGSNTKWCTTTERNPEYFVKYSKKGVLIYCINKKNGYKVASFRSLDVNDPEFSFWNQQDTRIDSLQTELPQSLLTIIRTESMVSARPNLYYLAPEELSKESKLLSKYGKYDLSVNDDHRMTMDGGFTGGMAADLRTQRIRRALTVQDDDIREVPREERGIPQGEMAIGNSEMAMPSAMDFLETRRYVSIGDTLARPPQMDESEGLWEGDERGN